ncbi:MAG: protein-glutamate O-methyltransferase CheR [Ammonifex sp.]|jgi:chemotaxis protein methyltransferase CheR|nr:MAG: protein-glutamate O-methyltransferase CheR [Ammonifex sp.]
MDFNAFKKRIDETFNLDLSSYKETQLHRRINSLMSRRKIVDYLVYYQLLVEDQDAFGEFKDYLTINVTEFFRDPAMFRILEEKVLPELLSNRMVLKIWSAACSNGAEPYSVAMILEDLTPGRRHRIEATDIDEKVLDMAARGVYTSDLLRNVSKARRARHFREGDGCFTFNEQLKKRISFRIHDLLKDPYGKGFDLIICRNVQIYFTRDAQDKINRLFNQALSPGGYLFVGSSETIFNYRDLCFDKSYPCFYKKTEGGLSKDGTTIGAVR